MSAGVNIDTFDRFSIAHAASGFVAERAGMSFVLTVVLAIGWEIIENDLKDTLPRIFPNASHDTPRNAFGDVLAAAAGWIASRVLRQAPF